MTDIVGILRFSVVSTIYNPFRKSRRLSFERYVEALFATERLNRRMALLELVCLSALDKQTDPDFKLLIVAPRLLPHAYRRWLNKLVDRRDYASVAYVDETEFRMSHVSEQVVSGLVTSPDSFITFRLDDDDALNEHFVERLRPYNQPAFDDMCVSLCRGFYLDLDRRAQSFGLAPQIVPNVSVGLGYVSRRDAPRTIFDVSDRHHYMHRRRPVITDARHNAFVLTTHGENDTGAQRLLAERDLAPRDAARALRRQGFHTDLRRLSRRLSAYADEADGVEAPLSSSPELLGTAGT